MTTYARLEALRALRRNELEGALAKLEQARTGLAHAERRLQEVRAEAKILAAAGPGLPRDPMPAAWLACGSALHALGVERATHFAALEEEGLRRIEAARETCGRAGEAAARATYALRAIERGMAAARRAGSHRS
ncbi:MAG: hypothetical protein PHU25_06740 [Deltaproteobacteria bacterium]|nr:hypothetical protein [Deltaproteobacteria bacterium]